MEATIDTHLGVEGFANKLAEHVQRESQSQEESENQCES